MVDITRREAKPSEAEQLGLPPGAVIYHLTRVRMLSGQPVMIERTAFPERVGALVAGIDADRESIYERLEELGVVFADAEHVIDAVPASADDARLLGCRPRAPLLRERRRTTDPAGVPLEWSEDRYLGSAVAFTVHNSVAVSALSRLPSHPATLDRSGRERTDPVRPAGAGVWPGADRYQPSSSRPCTQPGPWPSCAQRPNG